MKAGQLTVVAMALFACLSAPSLALPGGTNEDNDNIPLLAHSEPSHPSKPPRRIADCVTYVLVDNKCTADWYKCSDEGVKGRCVNLWNDCCTLPGNPGRTTIVRSPQR
jgi:hypothetical protein